MTDLGPDGQLNPHALLGEFRRTEVLLPVVDGSLLSAPSGGIRWIFTFTSVETLEHFAKQRPETIDEWVPVHGAQILDRMIPAIEGPTGVALDAGSPASWMLPPVVGIVPDAVAVDAAGVGPAGAEAGGPR
ncbi:SseB family protein [Streptomyces sp. NBC_01304]|uniref:SseB family protein n=1 Tax=Streptomyces sp. NBC_01304 TaxID=2903818 RepID=UPI002E0E3DD8|nr:SseB family protein [Streptomyces sp. NBC_01304]